MVKPIGANRAAEADAAAAARGTAPVAVAGTALRPPWRGLFRPVKRGRGPEQIVAQIHEAVLFGRLKVGDRLPDERTLVAYFGCSRPTLREAIRVLESEGLVDVRRGVNGGISVQAPTADRVGFLLAALLRFQGATAQDFTDFRSAFEAENAFAAAEHAAREDIAVLEQTLARAAETVAAKAAPWRAFVEADVAFHEQVARCTGNPIRVGVMLGIHEAFLMSALALEPFDTPSWRTRQLRDLTRMTHAIRVGEAATARRLMRGHIRKNTAAEQLRHQ